MPTLYQSILLAQPADGDTVFIRRFTRDPPVLARWDLSAQNFTLLSLLTITIAGGTQAGAYTLFYGPTSHGFPAWWTLVTGVEILIFDLGAGSYEFDTEEVSSASGWFHPLPSAPVAGMVLNAPFTPFNSPTITTPATVKINTTPTAPLIIPASLVQAWRPQ